MDHYTVQPGDCLASIAQRYGLFWKTIWLHSENSELRRQRNDCNVLRPGDVVFVPDKELRWETGNTETCHRFVLKGVPVKLRLQLFRDPQSSRTQEQPRSAAQYPLPREVQTEDPVADPNSSQQDPRANVAYTIYIDGKIESGTTDGDGKLEINIPPCAQNGRLVVEPGTPNEVTMSLNLGHLNPITEISGIKQRLTNLGMDCGDSDENVTEALRAALRAFQRKHDLQVSGEIDDQTRSKLQEIHGD